MADQDAKDKLEALRRVMKQQVIDAFIVPRADEYQGEFVAAYAERLKWLTGFTGSGGCAVVMQDKAVVLTDGRYLIQVETEVDDDVFTTGDITKTGIGDWLKENLEQGATVGCDPMLHTPAQLEKIEGFALKAVPNLIDEIWSDQPVRPSGAVQAFPEELAGKSSAQKRAEIAALIKGDDLDGFILTAPDSISWLLNIRGSDIKYIPYALSTALIETDGSVLWFIDPAQVPEDMELGNGVGIIHPDQMQDTLRALAGKQIGIDYKTAPVSFKTLLEENGGQAHDMKDPCSRPRSLKNKAEQDAIKRAHIHDGVALVNFLYWLEREAPKGGLTELDVAVKLEEYRKASPTYRGPSFPSIVGWGSNGAIVHYRPTEAGNATITPPGFLLIDSGGQYCSEGFAGTTDITRTIAVGEVSAAMKRHFTFVLKGHIALAHARFGKDTLGKDIDALARAPLQAEGLDYAHGTGHGVGCYLQVHEEAANLSPKGENTLQPGMLLSNEPGFYQGGLARHSYREFSVRTRFWR